MTGVIVFPRAGLSCSDIKACAGMRMADAAKKLGLSYSHLVEVAKDNNFTSIFAGRNRYRFAPKDMIFPDKGISRESIVAYRGMLKKDVAEILGVDEDAFSKKIKRNPDLHALFPSRGGEAWWISKRGYAGV